MRSLACLAAGECARVRAVVSEDAMRRRLMELGFVEGTRVRCALRGPPGGPAAYWVRGAMIALRRADARSIWVSADS
ncbi:MAG: ferrous iron transport protein A [Oscillospiraceae bacterium]|nr:ferrous iron transport protein A [Oscillospiraceae bacterium]